MWQSHTQQWAEQRWTKSWQSGKSAFALGHVGHSRAGLQLSGRKRQSSEEGKTERRDRQGRGQGQKGRTRPNTNKTNEGERKLNSYWERVKFFIKYIQQHSSISVPRMRRSTVTYYCIINICVGIQRWYIVKIWYDEKFLNQYLETFTCFWYDSKWPELHWKEKENNVNDREVCRNESIHLPLWQLFTIWWCTWGWAGWPCCRPGRWWSRSCISASTLRATHTCRQTQSEVHSDCY